MVVEKKQFVKDLRDGNKVKSLFLLAEANLLQAKNGPFWRIELKDNTGSIEGKIWSPLSSKFQSLNVGNIVEVSGRVVVYKDKLEINIEEFISDIDEKESIDITLFLPSSPRKSEEMLKELFTLSDNVLTYLPWKNFISDLFNDEYIKKNFPVAPGAKVIHHAYAGGLLEHTLAVAKLCMIFADNYPELDRQLLMVGAMCHDLGKLWELTDGYISDYTTEGRLLGHIELGLEKIETYLGNLDSELRIHLKHLILSHHGELEFGSPKRPKTPEAFALNCADNLDAKLAQCRSVIESMPEEGPDWSPFQNTLGRFIYRAPHTPSGNGDNNKEIKNYEIKIQKTDDNSDEHKKGKVNQLPDNQCSLI